MLSFSDERRFEGEWVDDKAHGFGTFVWRSGNKYEGQWLDNRITGTGTLTYASSDRYEGEFRSGRFHGRGVYTYSDGDVYDGEWQEDLRSGKGRMTFASGDGGVEEHRVEPHLKRLCGMAGQAKARIDHHGHLRKCGPQAAQPVQVVQPQP